MESGDVAEVDALREGRRNVQPGTFCLRYCASAISRYFRMRMFCGQPPDSGVSGGDARDEQRPRPERPDAIQDVAVQSVDDGRHRNHGGHADDDAQNGQPGADLAGAQGVEGHQQVLFARYFAARVICAHHSLRSCRAPPPGPAWRPSRPDRFRRTIRSSSSTPRPAPPPNSAPRRETR